jgi:DNA helicase-2/ATP-dependent DNA helicase PcrA
LVDEYQDTNRLQGDIVDICASHHGNLTAVGDDAQSIYSFRGAHIDNMVDFAKRHPGAQVFKLETNYRSVPEVLRLANRSIRHNTRQLPKVLRAVRPPGMMPVLLPLADVHQQAALIAQRVLELHQEEDIPLRQMAVLYRAHAHSMELQIELARREIPFVVRSGLRFFEQAHIKDVVAYLRVVHNARDPLAWQRILRTWSGVGRRTSEHVLAQLLESEQEPEAGALLLAPRLLERVPSSARPALKRLAALLQRLQAQSEVAPAVQQVLEGYYRDYLETTYANAATREEDLAQLADYARRYESLEQFLSELSLVAGFAAEGVGVGEVGDDALVLSTIHQAKGLEWRIVFVIGLAEGRFPQPMAVRTPAELEEERRLFYVAATRAKDQLYLCHPRFDESGSGPRRILRLSRFVDELGHDGAIPYERWEIEQD